MKQYFKTFLNSLNPFGLHELADRLYKDSLLFLLKNILLGFLIIIVLLAPAMFRIGSWYDNNVAAFDKFELNGTVEMNRPIALPDSHPLVIIDTTNSTSLDNRWCGLLVSKEYIEHKGLRGFKYDTDDLKDVSSPFYKKALITAFFLMMPTLLVLGYVFFAVKYLLIAYVAAILAFIFVRVVRFDISFSSLTKLALYSSTIMVLLGMIKFAVGLNIYYADYIIGALYFAIGIIRTGSFTKKRYPKSKKGKGQGSQDYMVYGGDEF